MVREAVGHDRLGRGLRQVSVQENNVIALMLHDRAGVEAAGANAHLVTLVRQDLQAGLRKGSLLVDEKHADRVLVLENPQLGERWLRAAHLASVAPVAPEGPRPAIRFEGSRNSAPRFLSHRSLSV